MPGQLAANSFLRSLRLLRTRRFGTFWFASLLSSIGTWAQQVAQPWLMLSLGASSLLLGLDAFAIGAPVLLLTLVGGVLADRADRRRVIALFQSIQMLCPTLIVVLLVLGRIRPWMIIGLSLIVGITDALSMPSYQSIVPSIVHRDQLPAGIALNATQFNLSRILGPAVAGVLMVSVGASGAFAVSAASYVPFILVALWILPGTGAGVPGAARALRTTRTTSPNAGELLGVLRKVAGDPLLRGALLTVLVTSVLGAPLLTFAPVFVRQSFQGNVGHFSLAVGALGVGGLLGALALLGVSPVRDRRPIAAALAAVYALLLMLSAVDPWFAWLPVLLVLAGATMTASNSSANALLLASAPENIRGQTVSLFMLAVRGGSSVGSLLTGLSVSAWGVRRALLINGLLALIAQGFIGRAWCRSRPAPPPPPTPLPHASSTR